MPANGYTVGRDVVVDITTPLGPVNFQVRTGFMKKQETNDIKVKRADGITDYLFLPDGWSGTLDYERQDSQIDDYFAGLEQAYYVGINLGSATITETIQETNGNLSQYRYEGCVFKLDDAGSSGGDETIKQKIGWSASRRKKVS